MKRTLPVLAAMLATLLVPVSAFAATSGESLGKENVTEFMFITILVLIALLALVGIWEARKTRKK